MPNSLYTLSDGEDLENTDLESNSITEIREQTPQMNVTK